MVGAEQRFRAARAFGKVQPDHGRTVLGDDCAGERRFSFPWQTERYGRRRAELQESAPR
jgi:hypothetical protein